jgi:hypothetical protein
MRTQVLNALKQGIVRLRTKGGADPSTLYDLLNGFVTIDGSIQSRPGTVTDANLPAGTKGLCAFDKGLVVFSSSPKTGMPDGYTCVVLIHPTDPTQEIVEIHFSAPFLGKLYVVAEFANGDVYHYWLLAPKAWTADTAYNITDTVQPTVPNGYYYKIGNDQFPQAWQPNTQYAMDDVVVPTTINGWKYTVIEADGDNPASGSTEPDWPESDGATVTEEHDNAPPPAQPPAIPTPPGDPRYSNPGGSDPDNKSGKNQHFQTVIE